MQQINYIPANKVEFYFLTSLHIYILETVSNYFFQVDHKIENSNFATKTHFDGMIACALILFCSVIFDGPILLFLFQTQGCLR